MADFNTVWGFRNSDDRVSDLEDPVVKHLWDVQATGLGDALPQILSDGVAVEMLGEIDRDTTEERFFSNVIG